MNVLIIEDEELAVRKLTRLLQEVDPTLNIVGTAPSVRASVKWLETNTADKPTAPDLILMDI
jgi:two-component system, LytTR family, response regulator LytT